FELDWPSILGELPTPILVVGNPPWVTNAQLGVIGSANLPIKSNFQRHQGLAALTGKSNFDISEWILHRFFELLAARDATVAMLCKVAVARKVLLHAWKSGRGPVHAELRSVDAARHFGAAVDACFLTAAFSASAAPTTECIVYPAVGDQPQSRIGYRDGQLVADLGRFERVKHLAGSSPHRWRSGIKHDCAKVFELRRERGDQYRNGLGELVDLESTYLYPMLKSSDVADATLREPTRWMLVPQRAVGEPTSDLHRIAPRTRRYLQKHAGLLRARARSIYRKRPPFSIFGVGDYSFAPWKVAISGLYKRLRFGVIGPHEGKSVVFDDTCYFLACSSGEEATVLADLLNSDLASEFFHAFVFWDAKRPITVELLDRLDLAALAAERGVHFPVAAALRGCPAR